MITCTLGEKKYTVDYITGRALREMRKHAAWYMRGLKGAAGFRGEAGQIASLADLGELCRRVIEANE